MSKKYNIKYDEVFTYKNLYNAFRKCIRNVSWKPSVQRSKNKTISNLSKTFSKLNKRKFKSKGFYEFDIIERGKLRHIKSVDLEERIVQRCLCDNVLVPAVQNKIIYNNSACLPKKGVLFSLKRCRNLLYKSFNNYKYNTYVLTVDISSYFDSINHSKLKSMWGKIIDDKDILKLLFDLIDNFGDGKGLGLGSQISQVSAIYYLNELDHYILENYTSSYIRYNDDIIVFCKSKEQANQIKEVIINYLYNYDLKPNLKKTKIIKLSRGFKFLKTRFRILENGKILMKPNRRNVLKSRQKIKKLAVKCLNGEIEIDDYILMYKSTRGNFKRFNAYKTLINLDALFKEKLKWLKKNILQLSMAKNTLI